MKKLRVIAIAVCFGLLMASCSAGEPKTTIEEYNAAVASFNDTLMENAVLLSNIAQFENSYWKNLIKLGGRVDYDDIVSKAYDWLEEKSGETEQSVEQSYNEICSQYKAIISMNVEGEGNARVSEKLDEIFEAYNSLYLLVTSPSGSNNNFVESYNDYTDTIVNANSMISTLLSD